MLIDFLDEVLNSPRLLNLPLLLLANKQDNPTSLSVADIRESFDAWYRAGLSKRHADGEGEERSRSPAGEERKKGQRNGNDRWDDGGEKEERMASLDVMGVSALEG
jgi:ADP-ribosylation factor related protein 1